MRRTLVRLSRRLGACAMLADCACDDANAAEPAAPAPRADEFRSEAVETQLDDAERAMLTRGFAVDGDPWRGFLVEQGSRLYEAPMRHRRCYAILGVASEALRELDLRVFDGEGAPVAEDAQRGRGAAVVHCPRRSGTFYVAALATAGSGLFSVRRYSGPTGLEVRLDDLFGPSEASPPEERPVP